MKRIILAIVLGCLAPSFSAPAQPTIIAAPQETATWELKLAFDKDGTKTYQVVTVQAKTQNEAEQQARAIYSPSYIVYCKKVAT